MSGSEGIGLMERIAKLRRDTPRNGMSWQCVRRWNGCLPAVDVTARPNVDVT